MKAERIGRAQDLAGLGQKFISEWCNLELWHCLNRGSGWGRRRRRIRGQRGAQGKRDKHYSPASGGGEFIRHFTLPLAIVDLAIPFALRDHGRRPHWNILLAMGAATLSIKAARICGSSRKSWIACCSRGECGWPRRCHNCSHDEF